MTTLAGRRPVVQFHPTRRCNLACAHCYTSSGPSEKGELPGDTLVQTVADAAALGYRQLAVSGGEPFLYAPLGDVLAAARRAGMFTTVTTNGLVHTPERLAQVAPHLDLLAISVDGPPADHNLMRRNSTAFERMHRRLPGVRASGVPFGFLFTLTRYNADQLNWLAGFATEEGASFVQVHPLTKAGPAVSSLPGAEPDAIELLAALVEVERLRPLHPGLAFQLDVASRHQLLVFADHFLTGADAPITELVPILVVDDRGVVVPATHDLHESFHWGCVLDERLPSLAARWRATNGGRFADLLATTHATLVEAEEVAVHWYDTLATVSRRVSATGAVASVQEA